MSYSPFMLNNAPSTEAPWTNCKLDLVLWRFRVDKNLWSQVKFDKHRVLPWMLNPLSISTFSTQVNFKIILHALDLLSHTPWPSVSNSVLGFNAYLKQTWLPLKQTRLGRKYWVCCKNSELLSTISPDNGSGPALSSILCQDQRHWPQPSPNTVMGKHGQSGREKGLEMNS